MEGHEKQYGLASFRSGKARCKIQIVRHIVVDLGATPQVVLQQVLVRPEQPQISGRAEIGLSIRFHLYVDQFVDQKKEN